MTLCTQITRALYSLFTSPKKLIHEWSDPNDPRIVSLYRTAQSLICETTHRITRETTCRPLNATFLQDHHPELVDLENGDPVSAALFIPDEATLIGKAYGINVELKAYSHPRHTHFWTLFNTTTHKTHTFYDLPLEPLENSYVSTVSYDATGVPIHFTLAPKKKLSFPNLTLLVSPTSIYYETPTSAPAPVRLAPPLTLTSALHEPHLLVPEATPDGLLFDRKNPHSSLLSTETTIDQLTWAVTLVTSATRQSIYGGHAALFIEGVKNGAPFRERCHIESAECGNLLTGAPGKAFIRVDPLSPALFSRMKVHFISQSPTWLRPREAIQTMLNHILKQKQEQDKANAPLTPFDLRGRDVQPVHIGPWLFGERWIPAQRARLFGHISPDAEIPGPDNCITWARQMLKLASIDLPIKCSYFALATYPTDYTS
jgi:hypothetical protein